jgi:cation:H+ antiporter
MALAIILIIAGLAILIFGAEGLVRGASSMAKRWGIPPLVIGLTIVAFGTSAPELIVNLFAAFKGSADLAIGNIIGSNIANILLILGVSALIFPICLKSSTIWKEIPFAILAALLLFIMGNDALFDGNGFNAITRTDGLALISLFAIFMVYVFNISKNKEKTEEEITLYSWPISILFLTAGIFGLFLGGKLLVDNAVIIAKIAGLSESLIGLTIVAIGTSLPELVTSIVAAYHKHNDMAVGNIIGSNIFNIFWVLGLTGTIIHLPFNVNTNVDAFVGIVAVVLLFLFMFIGSRRKIDRWQGALFISLYIAYIVYLINRG